MPSLDEILSGSPEELLDWINAPVDPEKEADWLDVTNSRKTKGNAEVRKALSQSRAMDRRAEMLGEEPFPEKKPSFISRFLDTLDTPRQFVTGNIASLVGKEGYGDLEFLDAGSKGTTENITTGDLLRDTDYFRDRPIQRGVAGFLGDVLTDPLSFISPFGNAARTGGLALSREALQTIKGTETGSQIFNRLKETKAEQLLADAVAKHGPEGAEKLSGYLRKQAGREAAEPFTKLAILRDQKNQRALKIGNVGADALTASDEEMAAKALEISNQLGLSGVDATNVFDTLETLVRRPSIRLSGPLAGAGTLGKLPIFGSRDAEIAVVTPASEFAYNALANGWYGTVANVKSAVARGLENNPESVLWNTADAIGSTLLKANKTAVKFASLLSKRVQASGRLFGPNVYKDSINELARARGVLAEQAAKEAEVIFGDLATQPGSQEMFSKMSGILQAYPVIEAGGMQEIERLYGPKASLLVQNVRNIFDDLAKKETEAGLLGKTIEGYVFQMHNPKSGLDDEGSEVWNILKNQFSGQNGTPDFSAQRTFANIKAAKAAGYAPDENLFNVVAARLFHSKQAFAEKEFFERLAYQFAMRPEVYKKLLAATMDASAVTRKAAQNAISSLDLALDPEAAARQSGARFTSGGKLLDLDNYDNIRRAIQEFETNPRTFKNNPEKLQELRAALAEQGHMGLRLDDAERAAIGRSEQLWKDSISMIPGRHGESAVARAGANTLSKALQKQIAKDGDEEFWNSALPNGFVDAVNESLHGKNLLQTIAQGLRNKQGAEGELRSPLLRIASGYQDWTRFLKKTATIPWPAYWARNLTSAFFQPLQSVAALGESLNPFRIYRNARLLADPTRTILTETGERLTGRELLAEINAAGMTTKDTMASEFLNAYADQVGRISSAVKMNVPGLRETAEREAVKREGGILRRTGQKAVDFGQAMEAFGRQHVYMHLRLSGHDATSAAAMANRYMVDYQNGKTEFERNVLNNIFFFYAFSRGNAANMFMQMAMKPGALTTQLHAFDNVAETLKDPESYNHDPDYEDLIKTTRTDAQLSKYVGTNKLTGLPRVLVGAGLPVEDIGRYLEVANTFTRPGKLTWKEAMLSGGDAVQKSLELLLSQANPVLKTGLELLAKKDFYFDRPITDATLRKFPAWERDMPKVIHAVTGAWAIPDEVWKGLDKVTKTALGGTDNGDGTYTINPYAMMVLTKLLGAGRAINTRKFLTDPGVSNAEKIGRFTSGLNVREIDPETTLAYQGAKDREEYYQARDIPTSKKKFLQRRTLESSEEE